MSLSRVSAVNALLPAPSSTSRQSSSSVTRPPISGAPSERSVGNGMGQVFSVDHDDLTVALTASPVQSEAELPELAPGDVLLVKVLSTTPKLSLERLSQVPAGSPQATPRSLSGSGASAAMIPDQTAMLRMAWATPDAATLATSWRVLVLERLKQMASGRLLEHPHHDHLPRDVLQGYLGDMEHMQRGPIERWPFPIQAWSGMPLSLHLLSPKHNGRPGLSRKRTPGWGLRVSGRLPGLGRIELQTQLSSEGASLLILAEEESTWQRLREATPALVKAVNRAGWRLKVCQILRDMPAEETAPDVIDQPGHSEMISGLRVQSTIMATTLPQALFRVTAEVLVTLGAIGAELNPRYR